MEREDYGQDIEEHTRWEKKNKSVEETEKQAKPERRIRVGSVKMLR